MVSLPHCEQTVLVSTRWTAPTGPVPWTLVALQFLQRFGSFLKPLSAKNICSPAAKTNSEPHSAHFRTLSWYSIGNLRFGPLACASYASTARDTTNFPPQQAAQKRWTADEGPLKTKNSWKLLHNLVQAPEKKVVEFSGMRDKQTQRRRGRADGPIGSVAE